GFLAKGRLRNVGEFYLRFQDGDAYIKGGADSPENWLGYVGFDNTEDDGGAGVSGTGLHVFQPHAQDWNPGDPDWDRTDPPGTNSGRNIIGALNYLESVGVNSIYFLPMNIGGDARDTWPYVGPIDGSGNVNNDNTRFDVSKLAQWDIVFNHAQAKGIMLHFVLNEAEAPNKLELDDAELGVERKLFYREMIARFGYHNATTWNISEEYNLNLNLGAQRVIEFAEYFSDVDPYGNPLTVHNAGNPFNPNSGPWAPFVGEPDFDLTSLQRARQADGWGQVVADYRTASAAAGQPLAVMIDEPASPTRDVDSFDDFRKRVIWDILLSGGGGEWFINNRDQSLEDFREFDQIWRETTIARRFIEDNLPFDTMTPDNSFVTSESGTFGGAEVFVQPREVYAVYFPDASDTGELDLSSEPGFWTLRWFNPRTDVFEGDATTLVAGAPVELPAPPSDAGEDWAALVELDRPCPPDANADGTLDPADFNAWVIAFNTQAPACDQNGDDLCDPSDFNAWVANFNAGCP
ncbi:MAG: GC-type dockerin domain-anchored protein, partial [Planctomycetota bacterium]